MDNLYGSPVYQQTMDKKKAAFKQPSEKNKNSPKKEGFIFSFTKPFPEAATVPLPPDPEDAAVTSEKMFVKKPDCEQKDLEKEFFREDNKAAEHTLSNQYEEKIRPCIDLVDSLRALGIEKDLSLPAIAVIGDQSSGKSSVLEALSGVALPRGNGIVTRCPLELKLKRLPEGQAWQGKISFRNVTEELQDPSEVDRAIRHAQDVVAGPRGAISGQLISLEVQSPDVPDLTLIDLPGIARVAVGDQPKDIGDQIKMLLKKHIGCKETVNLVVVPCNVDIATTEALKMAQEVDPTGERTIGILTKPDLVDRGTEEAIIKILQNRVIPLKKGYMIVKCRGQQDIHNKVTLAAAIQQERAFFENHKHFRAIMKQGKATIPHLAEKLTNELVKHIIKTLPALESQIRDTLHATLQDLQRYNRGTPQTEDEKLFFLTDLIKVFNQDISQSTRGEEQLLGDEVRLFTKVRKEFCTWGVILLESAARAKKTVPSRVWKYEDQYRGREFPGFSNYKTFEDIIKDQIRELEEPAIQILNNVMRLVEEKFIELANRNFANFHNLSRVAKVKIEDTREKQAAEAERHIRAQFKMERIVYCQDDIYLGDLSTLKAENALGKDLQSAVVVEMVSHTSAYFSGASKRLSNQIPLIILSCVLHDFGDNVQTAMLQLLQEKEKLNFLLEEDTEAAKTRNYLSQRVDRLTKACQYLRDFSLL
ncbi:PREDICTED: interferon-induced GTP-binding protein Mx-like [Sturnus vulgaris]|uniref:interferon-induced GTP-binding protein Mx-like n=1 Tax=Sturnus vulgaris TaxID=9172 RepID=UPI000719EEFD|nr:PREDICTED: interferon-induced GTP-binding protein Mx-like [Sturnus vulgaris]